MENQKRILPITKFLKSKKFEVGGHAHWRQPSCKAMPGCDVEDREDGWMLFSASLTTASLSLTWPGAEENLEGKWRLLEPTGQPFFLTHQITKAKTEDYVQWNQKMPNSTMGRWSARTLAAPDTAVSTGGKSSQWSDEFSDAPNHQACAFLTIRVRVTLFPFLLLGYVMTEWIPKALQAMWHND